MMAPIWGSPLAVDGKVYLGDQDGDVAVFKQHELRKISEIDMEGSVYSSPSCKWGAVHHESSELYAITGSAGGSEK